MQKLIDMITPIDCMLLGITVIALIVALMAWFRAGRALQLHQQAPKPEPQHEVPVDQQEQRSKAALEITANKDEFDQVSLVLENTGMSVAKQINISINKPTKTFNAEGLSSGINTADMSENSAILPRLTVLNADNTLPIKEIVAGHTVELLATLTMSHGKISDFPVELKWKDEYGSNQKMKAVLTV